MRDRWRLIPPSRRSCAVTSLHLASADLRRLIGSRDFEDRRCRQLSSIEWILWRESNLGALPTLLYDRCCFARVNVNLDSEAQLNRCEKPQKTCL